MFESMINDNRIGVMTHAKPMMISAAVHAAIITMAIVFPLMFYRAINKDVLITTLFFPAQAPPATVAPMPPKTGAGQTRGGVIVAHSHEFAIPTQIPTGITPPPPDDGDAGVGIGPASGGGVGTGTETLGAGMPHSNVISEIFARLVTVPTTPPKPPLTKPPALRVSHLDPSRIIVKVAPVYPPIAAMTHVSGTVVLEAIIDEEGNVSVVKVVSGPVLLQDAAVKAVNQWKYTPTIQSGEPVRVNATININFELKN